VVRILVKNTQTTEALVLAIRVYSTARKVCIGNSPHNEVGVRLTRRRESLNGTGSKKGSVMIIFGAPRRYVQGPGAIESIGSEVARLGSSAVLVADETVLSLVGSSVASSCQAVGVALHCLRFGGDVTTAEILLLADQAAVDSPDVVIAAGGGKGIDAGKGLCARLGARLITADSRI
jgi:uncharacterized membrane protein